MPIARLKQDLTQREAAYRLLSACYYQPSVAWDEANLFATLTTILEAVSPEASQSARRMSDAWEQENLEELNVHYARLFVGPLSLQAPPYGSVYLDADHKVMGASTLEVRRYYREAGLEMDADFAELPDHIAVELEFISYLLQRAVASDNDADLKLWLERGHHFLDTFLGPWYRRLCAEIRANSADGFYTPLAECTELLVSQGLPASPA
jgi:TorA maturation chaperone TorD